MSDPTRAPGLPPEDPRRRDVELDACAQFRRLLERHLEGTLGVAEEALHELAWHEHLLGCAACRELLAAEEALEHFLASLPAPELPPALARRVVRRLRAHRGASAAAAPSSPSTVRAPKAPAVHESGAPAVHASEPPAADDPLDRLLALDAAAPADGLSERVLSGLAAEREAAVLDRLLGADALTPPPGLSGRVLAGLAAERELASLAAERERAAAPAPPPVRSRPSVWSLRAWGALAAGLLAVLGAAWLVRREPPADGALVGTPTPDHVGPPTGPPDDELLAALPVLEMWELLAEHGDEVGLVADPVYEVLLDFSEPLEAAPERAEPPAGEKPSKG